MEELKRLAVFNRRADNAQPGIRGRLANRNRQLGVASVKRIYGDWTGPGLNGWKKVLLEYSIQPIQQLRLHQGEKRDRQRHDHRCDGPSVHGIISTGSAWFQVTAISPGWHRGSGRKACWYMVLVKRRLPLPSFPPATSSSTLGCSARQDR